MTAKRVLDVVISLASLLVLSPVCLLAAFWVKADSSGPVLFRQERIGRFGIPFEIYKFRTMRSSAIRSNGSDITAEDDPRITRAGRMLRKYKLDELPQFYNVLRGDMSIVGPRPEVRKYVDRYPEQMRLKILSVRPGITDEASLLFRNESRLLASAADKEQAYITEILPKKLEASAKYVDSRSLIGDIKLIFLTCFSIVRG